MPVRQALSMAINLARETSRKPEGAGFAFPLIYVGGSTYLVSEAVQILKAVQLPGAMCEKASSFCPAGTVRQASPLMG